MKYFIYFIYFGPRFMSISSIHFIYFISVASVLTERREAVRGTRDACAPQKYFLKKAGGRTADVLPPWVGLRANRKENCMETRKDNTLESLDEKAQNWILSMAENSRLADLVIALKEVGIETSASSLSRFIKRDRERRLMEDGADSGGVVKALAERGKESQLREGTLEAVRQRLYEQALLSQS